ncbi:MAG: hypothetical protein Q4F13_01115 [Pseudomonadota bacterium]|nr:hypothetical protein [Pseudomonadota bacterium]
MPGLQGCALVEIEAGMVWHHAGYIEGVQTFAEAASDYWRLYQRLAHQFQDLGDLKASVMMHAHGRITLLPCGSGMLLVTLTRQKSEIDWTLWQEKTRALARLVDAL